MASVAAAVASGSGTRPSLTTQPAGRSPSAARARPATSRRRCAAFMASVVQPGGTAAGAGLPAGTFGKTGTAEFGNGNPPETHAWFIGYRGNLAFAVIVEGGGVGGRVAAPLRREVPQRARRELAVVELQRMLSGMSVAGRSGR